ncbi:MAG: phenylalanine--tRNA ligase subunit beta [Bacilli bacterium]
MRVKLEWLKELVDIEGITLDEIINKLSLYSTEVETKEKLVEATNLVVGYVKDRKDHENSDHLSVCMVDVGGEDLQIICGAPNVRSGQHVIVALNGAILPNGLKIKKTKIRGIESNGMICSLLELGIEKKFLDEDNQKGIYVFSSDVKVGTPALEALNLDDYVIELGLTPNRGDLLSMLGVAIEVSAVFNRPLKPLAFSAVKEESIGKLEVINETDLCLGYYGKVFKNVQIKASPRWLIARLIAFGIRPINNVVDITNYILALFGQPLHAFDYKKLGSKILVRKAHDLEEITTLDGVNRKLKSSDIVITDGVKPVAIAGVMGGADTEVDDNTKELVIEAAVFDSKSVRETSQRLGLRSDSSIRFEKGVDLNRTKFALNYASYLLKTYAEATVGETFFDKETILSPKSVKISLSDIENKLGVHISKEEVKDILERLKFAITDKLEVIIPTRRSDISIKEDVIEEIGRIYGYDNLPTTLPKTSSIGGLSQKQKIRREIIDTLTGLGLSENVTYSLVNQESNELFKLIQTDSKDISLLMPLSQDRKVLRKTLLPSLIESAKYSYNRKIKDLAIFELGRVYYQEKETNEIEHLAILLANNFSKSLYNSEKADFYLLKGIVEELFNKLNIEVKYIPLSTNSSELHPKRSAELYLDNEYIGFIGALHPKYASSNDLDDVYVCEINLVKIYEYNQRVIKYTPISKVPTVERDIAIVVSKDILAGDIIATIKGIKNLSLADINIFDIYTGEKLDNDKKSIALNLVFSSNETLTDEVINSKIEKVLKELVNKFNAVLRM